MDSYRLASLSSAWERAAAFYC